MAMTAGAAELAAETLRQKYLAAREEIGSLKAELAGWLDIAFRLRAYEVRRGARAGWWDTQALSQVKLLGDRLVELGKWERHPSGRGRRWWYRPKAVEAKGPTT